MNLIKNKKYNIAIDASRFSRTRTGIDFYTYYLIRTFYDKYPSLCSAFRFNIFISKEGMDYFQFLTDRSDDFILIPVPFHHPLFRQQLGLPWKFIQQNKLFDLFHSMGFPYPLGIKAYKRLITVYDIAFHRYPKSFTIASRSYWNILFPGTLKKSHQIITISKSTESELRTCYNIPEQIPIQVIYCGISPNYLNHQFSHVKYNEIKKKLQLPEKYILCVATLQPRKNIPFIIEIMEKFWNIYPQFDDIHLVLVGNKGWLFDEIIRKSQNPVIQSKIHFTGYIDDSDLPDVYAGALLFLYPSYYEGFGLPPLESMACGTPVIVSDRTSLPEIVGSIGRALPLEQDIWIKEIYRMVSEPDYRNQFIEPGITHARSFTWEKAAQAVIEVYHNLLK